MFFIWKAFLKTVMLLILKRYIFNNTWLFLLFCCWNRLISICFHIRLLKSYTFVYHVNLQYFLKTTKIVYLYKFYLNFKPQVFLDHNDIFSVLLKPCTYYLIFSVQSFTCFFFLFKYLIHFAIFFSINLLFFIFIVILHWDLSFDLPNI